MTLLDKIKDGLRKRPGRRAAGRWTQTPAPWSTGPPGALRAEDAIVEPPARISFIATLPFDIPTKGDVTTTLFGKGHFAGWEETHVAPLPWLEPLPWKGLRPLTSIWIRRGEVPLPDNTSAEIEAFGALLGIDSEGKSDVPPVTAPRAVVQITRISAAPTSTDEEAGELWVSDEFDEGLSELNEFLVTLASVAREPAIGPITRFDLPPAVVFFMSPLTLDDEPDVDAPAPKSAALLLHHGNFGVAADIPDPVLHHVMNVQSMQRGPGHPFFGYAEAMVSARRSLAQGRAAAAILESGTAMEVLVSATIREVAPLRGMTSQKAQNILDGSFKSRLEHHLGPLTGLTVDLSSSTNTVGAWYLGGYQSRNDVVHRGHRPELAEARAAVREVEGVVRDLGRALQADPATQSIGGLLVNFAR